MSDNQPTYPPAQPGYPGEGGPTQPPAKTGTNGLAIAGLILAFLIAPIGFILSIIGLITAGSRRQKGKGLAVAGIIVSLLIMGSGVALFVALGDKVAALADPGCATGKAAILDNTDKISSPDTVKDGLQTIITGLNSAADKASGDDVRNAMKAVADDYTKLLESINTSTPIDPALEAKTTADEAEIDRLCTIGA